MSKNTVSSAVGSEAVLVKPVYMTMSVVVPSKAKIMRLVSFGALKRAFDLVMSGSMLVILLPLFGVVAVAIKLDSPGPVFFRQKRTGKKGKEFEILKSRSMVVDNDMRDASCDDKYTKLGEKLRKSSMDELPLNEEFPNYQDVFLELMNEGYKVILAHPERYAIVQNDYGVVEELVEMGVLLQCNLGSITGKYGGGAKKVIKRLAKEKRIFALGSDIHHAGRGEYLRLGQKKLAKYYSDAELEKVLVGNARKIIAG